MTQDTGDRGKVVGRRYGGAKNGIPAWEDIGRSDPFIRVPLTTPSRKCQCGRCGNAFTSVSGFDKHQRLAKDGSVICLSPDAVGLVLNDGWWSAPRDPRFPED